MSINWASVLVTVISSVIFEALQFIGVQIVKDVGGPNPLDTFWKIFVIDLWPLWGGILIGLIYNLWVRFYRIQRLAFVVLPTQIQTLEDRFNTFVESIHSTLEGKQ